MVSRCRSRDVVLLAHLGIYIVPLALKATSRRKAERSKPSRCYIRYRETSANPLTQYALRLRYRAVAWGFVVRSITYRECHPLSVSFICDEFYPDYDISAQATRYGWNSMDATPISNSDDLSSFGTQEIYWSVHSNRHNYAP